MLAVTNTSYSFADASNKAFISHATLDKNFVNLLVALLEFHYVEAWCSLTNLQPGDPFREEIANAIRRANVLLVHLGVNPPRLIPATSRGM
jgi:hypothetical protein